MYPRLLYPGSRLEDPTSRPPEHPNLTVERSLTWYNPFGWLAAGLRARGPVLHVQWWSLPLAPVFITLLAIGRVRGLSTVCTVHNVEPHERSRLFRAAGRILYELADRAAKHGAAGRK